ncbi:hypothetical protein A1O3_09419 [Capronia epimyces CBS 606.96]|uniref:Uncharacterized protein n=1 Tax=Capronia epimyces CBS 606.96 TaxID=1182542 RepID=W9XDF8_9EURO|nr:uncharacterized protein A1O3_09419 [Capronia epimyces CBS 606.96]EXJ78258.1 hypothetical protein A1O3_09419 [Capronia epimyces CBS 606.96]
MHDRPKQNLTSKVAICLSPLIPAYHTTKGTVLRELSKVTRHTPDFEILQKYKQGKEFIMLSSLYHDSGAYENPLGPAKEGTRKGKPCTPCSPAPERIDWKNSCPTHYPVK